jgi:hypothetical protein
LGNEDGQRRLSWHVREGTAQPRVGARLPRAVMAMNHVESSNICREVQDFPAAHHVVPGPRRWIDVALLTLNRGLIHPSVPTAWPHGVDVPRRARVDVERGHFVRQQLAQELNVELAVAQVIGPIQENAQPGKTFNNAPKGLVQRGVVQITWLWQLHADRIQLLAKVRCRNPSRSRRQFARTVPGRRA